jgi:hypothetical protein
MATRAESLARLAFWADCRRRYPVTVASAAAFADAPFPETARDTETHGLAAVWAIRNNVRFGECVIPDAPHGTGRYIKEEARLAFRCALAAVGLRPVNGHHNL